jgi:hypothetical protein
MISDNPQFTDPAMTVIKRTDPDTYKKIAADNGWDVSTDADFVDSGADATTRVGVHAPWGDIIYPRDERDTGLDADAIKADAAYLGVPVEDYTASVIVHEFTHHVDGRDEEVPAYRESVRFDRLLPPRDKGMLEADLEELREQERGF